MDPLALENCICELVYSFGFVEGELTSGCLQNLMGHDENFLGMGWLKVPLLYSASIVSVELRQELFHRDGFFHLAILQL